MLKYSLYFFKLNKIYKGLDYLQLNKFSFFFIQYFFLKKKNKFKKN